MFICVECGTPVKALYSSYGKDNIILERCPNCNEIADKYTELDGVIKTIDLVLHKIPVYRHILVNSALKISARQVALFLLYLAMIEVHLMQPERIVIYRSIKIFAVSLLYNILYFAIVCVILGLGQDRVSTKKIRNALVLGSFPKILHLLFVIWDYPRNDQFNNVISIATLTSHFSALTAINRASKLALLAVIVAQLTVLQTKRLLLPN